MLSNKWMLICTLIGSIITVAMLSSIPTYTYGIMQRMLIRDMEIYQQDSGNFPGGYLVEYDGTFTDDTSNKVFNDLKNRELKIISKSIDLPIFTECNYLNAGTRIINMKKSDTEILQPAVSVSAMYDMEDHIKIIHGRMYSKQCIDNIYEIIVSEQAMQELGLTLDNTYDMAQYGDTVQEGVKIKIVGIFSYKYENDPYWFNNIQAYHDTIFMDADLFMNYFLTTDNNRINNAKWFYAYDYHKITLDNLPKIISALEVHAKWFGIRRSYLDFNMPAETILKQYDERAKSLKTTLLVFQIPVLLILAFYLFMVSKLKINFESNEIAILKSRGSSTILVLSIYLIESTVIGIIAFTAGPVLGLYLCRIIGASNGFLEFVQRSALPLSLKSSAYFYSLAAVLFISITMLIPAFIASRTSIVLYKQKKSRSQKTSFWKQFYLDFLLLAISLYGLYGYRQQQKVLFISGLKGTDLEIDPLLFLVSVLFVLGCGLFVLRVFPYVIRFIFWLGKKAWKPVLYATFTGVSRTSGKEQFAMLFIILTLSIGIFSANSARTINKNMEEKVRYEVGADIVANSIWRSNIPDPSSMPESQMFSQSFKKDVTVYFEPPFKPYTQLKGVESVTKVFKKDNATVYTNGSNLSNVPVMGIIPNEFGETAWFRSDLLPFHWYEYLNLMTDSPTAVLVSKAFKDKLKLSEGDEISINWGEQKALNCTIYAFIDYWPSLNPNRQIDGEPSPYFVVANFNYINAMHSIEPYQVWMKKKTGVTSTEIYNDMENKKIELESRTDTTELLVKRKNDPLLQGINGSLTLGFIVSIIVSIIGFLIYWVMSIKMRALQFGIFRAMGMTFGKIIRMLAIEQLLITGSSVAAGIAIGGLASKIFIPMYQLVNGAEEQVPPFKVVAYASDYIRLYIIVALMILVCFTILWRIISRINIGQALKLGED
jgi:putative ABC transport system permease protein